MLDKETTWRDLKAQGIKRCCAMFKNGERCRRRASDAFEGSWCERHGPVIKQITDETIRTLRFNR